MQQNNVLLHDMLSTMESILAGRRLCGNQKPLGKSRQTEDFGG